MSSDSITKLDMSKTGLLGSCGPDVADMLTKNKSLKEFCLGFRISPKLAVRILDCDLDEVSRIDLAAGLRSLNLSDNEIGTEGCLTIGSALYGVRRCLFWTFLVHCL